MLVKKLEMNIKPPGDNPFQQLSEEEQEARIKNYIAKYKGRFFNTNEEDM